MSFQSRKSTKNKRTGGVATTLVDLAKSGIETGEKSMGPVVECIHSLAGMPREWIGTSNLAQVRDILQERLIIIIICS